MKIENIEILTFCHTTDEVRKNCGKYQEFLSTFPEKFVEHYNEYKKDIDKKSYLASRYLLYKWLKEKGLTSIWTALEVNFYGKPYLKGKALHFNISHSGNWVVMAGSEHTPLGVDVEAYNRPIDYMTFLPEMSEYSRKKIMAAEHKLHEFFNVWTQLESIAKADGRGLSIEIKDIILTPQGGYVRDRPQVQYRSQHIELDADHIACISYIP